MDSRLARPADMQGHSLVPLLKGQRPAGWRTRWYYRYYHDPAITTHVPLRRPHRHPQAHLFLEEGSVGNVRLGQGPNELHNLYDDPAQKETVAKLKTELYRLKKEVKDDDQFANQQPPQGVSGQPAARRKK